MESTVRSVTSLEWSTGNTKFEAWPVDPPGSGSGPLSSWTMSRHPSSARWLTAALPTTPAPNHHHSDTRHPDPRADSCLAQAAACSLIVGICTGTRRVAFRFLVASHIRQQLVEIVVDVFIAEMALVPSRRDTTHRSEAVPSQRGMRQRRVVLPPQLEGNVVVPP